MMGMGRRLQRPDWAHSLMWFTGMWFALMCLAGFGRTRAGIFYTQKAGCGSEANRIAHPNDGAVTNHLRSA
jgi:hypothetical protein